MNHTRLYNHAQLYDIAFGFRDLATECRFLTDTYQSHHQRRPASFLELGAGPAEHAIEMSRQGLQATALDLSEEMVAYGQKRAADAGTPLHYVQADMVSFSLAASFDLAVLLMDSSSYLLSNAAVCEHLRTVARHLSPGGLYILEMSHPKAVFEVGGTGTTSTDWEMERDGIQVHMQWGQPDDVFDPISQITKVTAKLTARQQGQADLVLTEQASQRCFTANEFMALVQASGCFEVVELFGSLDRGIAFDNEPAAWRMVPVLRKLTA